MQTFYRKSGEAMFKDDEKTTKLKNLLYSYTYIEDEIEGINEEICNLGEVINSQRDIKALNLTGMPRGNEISDVVYESVEKIIMTYGQEIAKLENRLDKAFRKRNLINSLISLLDPTEKKIIELKYFKKYKIWMISGCVNYGKSQVHEIHNNAIKKMSEVYYFENNI
jgi:DNA-directed RNA polymerase specialized sigma subunit